MGHDYYDKLVFVQENDLNGIENILVKEENYERAMTILASEGYTIV